MDKIINIELLGHPLNWVLIILVIIIVWFGVFALASKINPAAIAALDTDDSK